MSDLVLVRHGETIWHAENRYAGVSDIALNDKGHEQAKRLATWAASAKLSSIWVSPLSRAVASADPAVQATKLELKIDPRLREIDFGRAEGRTMGELETEFPEEAKAFKSDPVAHPMPGGEDPHKAAQRAVECLWEIAQAHENQRVLIMAHNTLIRLALCQLLGIPLETYRTVFPSVRNGALTEVRLHKGKTALLQFNAPLNY